MQDENAQVAQEGINAGKKLLQGLEKNKKELENTAKNVTRPVANKAKNKAVSAAKETKAGKTVEKTVQNVTGSAKKAVKKMMKKMTAETKKMAKNAGVEAKAATEKAMVDAGNTVGSAAGVATLGVGTAASQGAAAAKKASIHDFIMKLPKGYDTEVGELGDTLSGGEKQRIGIARAFLHDSPLILMDEPTSNLDSLNEGIILKSLREAAEKKTVVLVSHRKSTMNIVDTVFEMKDGRIS